MKKLGLIFTLFLMILTGCYYAYYPQTGSASYKATYPEEIRVYSGAPDQDYMVMGSVAVDVIGDADAAVKHLKKKAAEMGADAIINAKLTKVNSSASRTGISGVAVKLKQNLADRNNKDINHL